MLLVALALRLALALTQPEVADTPNYRRVAETLVSGGDLYTDTRGIYPYPPIWAGVEKTALRLSHRTAVPFVFWVKLPSILADLAITLLVFLLSAKLPNPVLRAAGYALSPIAILVSSAHGQFDALPILCTLLAVYAFEEWRNRDLSALALMLGIALKSFPVLFLPLFLLRLPDTRSRVRFTALATLPVALLLVPDLLRDPRGVAHELFAYSGAGDHGWMAAARALRALRTGVLAPGEVGFGALLKVSKVAFLAGYAGFLFLEWRRSLARPSSLLGAIAAVIALFYALVAGISSQCLVWILPFLLVAWPASAALYTGVALLSLVPFYATFYPALLGLRFEPGRIHLLVVTWLVGSTAFWLWSVLTFAFPKRLLACHEAIDAEKNP